MDMRWPAGLRDRVDEWAARYGMTRSEAIREAVTLVLDIDDFMASEKAKRGIPLDSRRRDFIVRPNF